MSVILAALIVPAAFLLLPVSGGASEGGEENVYIVKPGDTLSRIAGEVLGDPMRWSELLEANPQITDPTLIFPGDSISLPASEGAAPMAEEGAVEEEAAGEVISVSSGRVVEEEDMAVQAMAPAEEAAGEAEAVESGLPVETVQFAPVVNANLYRSTGYISKDLPEIPIVSSVQEREGLGAGDEIFLGTVAEEGATFTVVRPITKVFHPQTREYLGWLIRIQGWAVVNCTGESCSRAILQATVDTVEVGDYVIPYDAEDILEENTLGRRETEFCLTKEEEGYIVATQEDKEIQGEGDVVFLDRGMEDGVKPGDLYIVYRHATAKAIDVIGQLQVLRVGAGTSSALVINSIKDIELHDLVQSWQPPMETSSGG